MTNPLDIMKNELFLQDPDYNEINGIMETEKVRFHEWLNGVMFSEKEVKTYQAFPVKVAPVIEDDIKLKIEGPAPVQARPTFLRRVYYHLPSGIQDRVKPIVKNYIKKKAQ